MSKILSATHKFPTEGKMWPARYYWEPHTDREEDYCDPWQDYFPGVTVIYVDGVTIVKIDSRLWVYMNDEGRALRHQYPVREVLLPGCRRGQRSGVEVTRRFPAAYQSTGLRQHLAEPPDHQCPEGCGCRADDLR